MLPRSLTKRAGQPRPVAVTVTESYEADSSVEQLARTGPERIADRTDELAHGVTTDRVESGQAAWPTSGIPAATATRFGIAH